ncbi:ty3-gypsy retrotransposon protein [Cucumis melo var. makuwa]|uniref:Ty3-gypsy retrotransposon protein n=1 Tax=Cucumis melo var. makuwa TaxID=1194695 RepID=A0A5D3DBG9_CUCMM|nr:ty3-gypsy retrotransposon protein [Cucumis melo var. makuwa]TYK20932.1 ty3-gypsy retrotransposon protein [Cucumis melo var. makuwa]
MMSSKVGIVIKKNPSYDNTDSTSYKSKKKAHPDVMFVMMVDITTEAAMAEMERKINLLMKVVKERDHEIKDLKEHIRIRETAESSQIPVLQDMVANFTRAQYGGPSQTSFMYSKPYTKRINNLRMLLGSRGDQLVRQFVQSLKGNTFEWYTDLKPEVIDSWE